MNWCETFNRSACEVVHAIHSRFHCITYSHWFFCWFHTYDHQYCKLDISFWWKKVYAKMFPHVGDHCQTGVLRFFMFDHDDCFKNNKFKDTFLVTMRFFCVNISFNFMNIIMWYNLLYIQCQVTNQWGETQKKYSKHKKIYSKHKLGDWVY